MDAESQDPVVVALSSLVPTGVDSGRLTRESDRQLRWVAAGSATPPVVLVSGAGEVGLDWAVVLPSLAERARVIAYDRAGLGASDADSRLTLGSQVRDLVALLDDVGPAVLVGHSWGGLLAQLAAFARPDQTLGLVLLDPFHEDSTAEVPLPLRVSSNLLLNAIPVLKAIGLFDRIAATMGRTLAERCTDDPETQASITHAYRASYRTFAQVTTIRAENRLANTCTREVRAARATSTAPDIPMRILTATRGKPAALRQRSDDLADQTAAVFPHGVHVVVPDSGHYIHKDQPAAVVEAVRAVLAQANQDTP
ncbi:pimeloyl-ACP methyl ester carboxylesterase [Micromonospora vinacea]|uniref:Pimeloyl-ACP methyl ester carboxylesterase n=1 Tax=Micromonospora vinacea TaxID=709878 RepID=A0ABS0K6L1_9ACTN|nr:alpha/beta hydrolase [Micromonospora vinacea]MBG6104268.1 pimeloyl-ACP methyl ester carboxylesterase [Micromonospora vinacea]